MSNSLFVEKCWFLTGPTASGKTSIALNFAQQIDAEIVSLDSMSIYRTMDIGTAKPTLEQRAQVPHHLIDIRDPNETFSVSTYVQLAEQVAQEILDRGNQVLFVGGTPLYLKALVRGLFEGPPADEQFRAEIMAEAERVGTEALHQRLEQVDPLSAAKLHPNDLRRIVRALEVQRATGQPISHQQLEFDEGRPADQCRVFVLDWPRPILHERINERVNRMFDRGFVDEVRAILDKFGDFSQTAKQAVGYAEVVRHLNDEISLERAMEATKTRTRQFAKRQITWFRSLSECQWVPREEGQSVEAITSQFLATR